MRIEIQERLIPWDALEDSPCIRTLQRLLRPLPDADLPKALQAARGNGRAEYPVAVL